MKNEIPTLWKGAILLGLLASMSGCIVAPVRYHDGYWDHEHNRYWYGNGWHACGDRPEYCR